jgi:hypothetical protein
MKTNYNTILPLHDCFSFRQKLIKLRSENPGISKIPINEKFCIENDEYMAILKEEID